jgi:hypothetical protein
MVTALAGSPAQDGPAITAKARAPAVIIALRIPSSAF